MFGHRGGCGLCMLFPSDNVPGEGATVTIEIVGDTPDYVLEEPTTDYEVVEEETIPGGSVVRVNETTIRVLDENGEGIYFLLKTDTATDDETNETEMNEDYYNEYDQYDNEPVGDGTIDENLPTVDDVNEDGEKDYERIDEEDSIDYGLVDENTQTDEGNSNTDENTPREDDNSDDNNKEYDETTDTTFETTDDDLIDEDESVTELDPALEVTTQFDGPAVFDEGRFDIANDKIVDEKIDDPVEVNTETNKETYPDTDSDLIDESKTVEEEAEIITDPNLQEDKTTPEAITTYPDETQTSPTLGIDNIDEGLL